MPRTLKIAGFAACVGLAACSGRIEDPAGQRNTARPGVNAPGSGDPGDPSNPGDPSDPSDPSKPKPPAPLSCEASRPIAVPLRRINATQYRNTIRDLFGGLVVASTSFPETTRGIGYSTLADANMVTQLGAEQLLEAAEDVAESLVRSLTRVLPCARQADDACAQTFVDTFGRRAFRRPLRADERALLLSVYTAARVDTPFPESIGLVAEAMLQMPQFLYLLEEGDDAMPTKRLTGYEIATRLAYLFSNTTPDETLLQAARAGLLDTAAGVEAQARRLLGEASATEAVSTFFREWLGVTELATTTKDAAVYPEWNAQLASAMSEEIDRFVAHVMSDEGGSLEALLTSPETYVNRPLATLYGLGASVSTGPTDWKLVTLPADQRAGLLTKAGLLAAKAHDSSTSPIFRGKFVRTQLLCDEIPPPPPDAQANAPEFPAGATQREKSEILMAAPSCGGCHRMMNPIGLGFENYDALGKWQTTEANGQPIDVSGVVNGGPIATFQGAVDLARQLSTSAQVRGCMVKHWFRYTFGKLETASDACAIDGLQHDFAAGGVGDLLVAIARSDAFSHRSGGDE